MAYEKLPEELKSLNQWGLYKRIWQPEKNKYTKIPYDANTGQKGKSNAPDTWVTFDEAVAAKEKFHLDGLGFFFGNGYMGIDIDHAKDDVERYLEGDITDNVVNDFMSRTHSYSELSMSGEGIHIIIKGKVPGERRRKGNVEMYDSMRFFAMTGNFFGSYPEINNPEEKILKELYDKYLQADKVVPIHRTKEVVFNNLTEAEVINKALSSKNGDRFKLLLNGDWEQFYTSQSEADLAFANDLAFWTGRDFNRMDTIFRQSSLMRDKWDEKHGKTTYGVATLNKAIYETSQVYTPASEKPKYELGFIDSKPKKDTPQRSFDDTGNADRFMDKYGDVVKYSYIDKKFYVFNGSYWEVDNKGLVRSLIDNVVADIKDEHFEMPGVDPEEIEKMIKKHIKHSKNNSGKKALLDELKHRVPVLPTEFDRNEMLLNVDNGYLDLSNGELKNHDLKKMFSLQADIEYTDTIDAPMWNQFLNDVFDSNQELIEYVQKVVGYSLTGSVKEQQLYILFGNGRNGKSIFLDTLSDIFGSYSKTIQANSIMVKQNSSGPNSDIARLAGARLVTSSEPNEGLRLDEGLVKQLTGGDKVTARKLYGEEFEFKPQFKLWLATNHKPIIRGTDDGIWRRVILIPFTVQIPDEKVDKDLKYKLQSEAIGILNWAVDGCLKWQKYGLQTPEIIKSASKGYREEMDVINQFINERCEVAIGFSTKAGDLYKNYSEWAKENNQYVMSSTKFGTEMRDKFNKKRVTSGYVYEGIQLRTDPRMGWIKEKTM